MKWKYALAAVVVGGTACVLLSSAWTGGQTSGPPSAPVLSYWWRPLAGEVKPGKLTEVLHEFRDYVRENYTDVRFSAYQQHFLEADQKVHSFVEAKDAATLDRFWSQALRDPEIDALMERWEILVPGQGEHLLRQIAGEQADGVSWASGNVIRRSARIRFGKLGDALESAKAITDHINRSGGGFAVRAYFEFVGDEETIRWFTSMPNAAPGPWERFHARLVADPVYLRMLDDASEFFVEDSLEELWLSPVL